MVIAIILIFFSGCSGNTSDNNNIALRVKDYAVDINSNPIKKTASPNGFSGASMHRLNLYSNGDVHLIIYNGEGYNEENIISDEVIAKNVTDIVQSDESETIVITGKDIEIVNSKYAWIVFKNE